MKQYLSSSVVASVAVLLSATSFERRKKMTTEGNARGVWRDKVEGAKSFRSTFPLSLFSFIFYFLFFGRKARELRRAKMAAWAAVLSSFSIVLLYGQHNSYFLIKERSFQLAFKVHVNSISLRFLFKIKITPEIVREVVHKMLQRLNFFA